MNFPNPNVKKEVPRSPFHYWLHRIHGKKLHHETLKAGNALFVRQITLLVQSQNSIPSCMPCTWKQLNIAPSEYLNSAQIFADLAFF